MQKTINWRGLSRDSEEHCRVVVSSERVIVQSDIIGTNADDTFFSLRYELGLTPDWQVHSVLVQDNLDVARSIKLWHENGHWSDAKGNRFEAYDGADFIDISLTPLTNTLPIRRLSFTNKKPQKISVLYIDTTTFAPQVVEQLYSKLDDHVYRFQDPLQAGFTAELTVDDDGFVIAYPGLFERIYT